MTGSTSLVPAVKALLIDHLGRDAGLRDRKVQVGSRPLDPQREAIYVGGALMDYVPGPMKSGRQLRDEEAQIVLLIVAAAPGQASQDAEDRAFELLAVVDDLLANNPTLDGDLPEMGIAKGLQITQVQAGDADPNTEGWEGLIRVTLTYSARLT